MDQRSKWLSKTGPPWLRFIGFVSAALIGLLLFFAGIVKAIEISGFVTAIESLRLGESFYLVPEGWGWPLALAGVVVEVVLGMALLVGHRNFPILTATAALLVFFLGITVIEWAGGTEGGCGCFGSVVTQTPQQEFFALLVYLAILAPAFLVPPARGTLTYWRGLLVGGAAVLGVGLPLAGPWLPSHTLAAAIGRVVPVSDVPEIDPRATLDVVLPELWEDERPHLVVMTSFADGPALAPEVVLSLTELAAAPDLPLPVWFLVSAQSAEPDPDRYNELQWSVGLFLDYRLADELILQYYDVQWGLRGRLAPGDPVPERMLRAPPEFLPQTFWIQEGRIHRAWAGVPSLEEVHAAAVQLGTLP